MAIIRITIDDKKDARGDYSDMGYHLEYAPECDGEDCGKRPELLFPTEQYDRGLENYLEQHGKPPQPLGPHWHIVGTRSHADARPYYYYVPLDGSNPDLAGGNNDT